MIETIYVKLLNEPVDVWRPVSAERLGDDEFRIVQPTVRSDTEVWEFLPDMVVRCHRRLLDGSDEMVAVEAVG